MLHTKSRLFPLLLALGLLFCACTAEPEPPVSTATDLPSEPGISSEGSSDVPTVSGGITLPPDDPVRYVVCTEQDLHKGDLLLVNHTAPYDASLYEGVLTDVRSARVTEIQEISYQIPIVESLLRTLEALQTDLQSVMNDRVCLLVNDSYRSAEAQQATIDEYLALYGQAYVDKYVAPVGYSEHHTGLAVDLSFYNLSNGAILATTSTEAAAHYAWFLKNCGRYGLILRYPPGREDVTGSSETWHFRYVGVPHAGYIASHNLVLEEYLDLLKKTSLDDPLFIQTEEGDGYRVYYVPMTSGETQVPVPKDKAYTLSGNNADGFIVTVEEAG